MAQAQPFTLRCQGMSHALAESGSQGTLLSEDRTEDYPVDCEPLRHALELLIRYWFSVVTLPERRSL